MDEIYEIQHKDTLSELAKKFNMTEQEIMDLNPDYRGFIEYPSGEMIYEGDTLNIKKQKPAVKAFSLLKDALRKTVGIKDDKKFKETLVGELLGGGQPFKETGIGKVLGGGKPIGETKVGGALNKILGGGKPIKETGVGKFFSTEETPVLDAIFPNKETDSGSSDMTDFSNPDLKKKIKNIFGKELYTVDHHADLGPNTEFTISKKRTKAKGPEGKKFYTGSEKEEIDSLLRATYTPQKRGGGLIQKYDEGGIFGDFFTNLLSSETGDVSAFGETGLGEFLGSEEGQEGISDLSSALQKREEPVEYETEKERLEAVADQKILQTSNYVDYLGAGAKAATGNIPGAIMDMGKIYLDIFGRRKEKRQAKKGLKKLEKKRTDAVNLGLCFRDAFPFLSDSYKRYLSGQYALGGETRRKRPEHLKYDYASGGMVRGASHKNGGVKYNVGGEVVELEGGEAVINKKSTKMFRPLLSKLNQAGGGTSFARGGLVNPSVNRMINRLMNKNR